MPSIRAREARHAGLVANQQPAARRRRAPSGPASATRRGRCRRRERRSLRRRDRSTGSLANGVSRFSRLFSRPRGRRSAGAQDGAEARVGDHVGPRRRRVLIALEHDRVGAAVVGEAADAVGQRQRRHRHVHARPRRRLRATRRRPSAGSGCDGERRQRRPRQVRAQVAAAGFEHRVGDRHEQRRARPGPSCRSRSRNAPPGWCFHIRHGPSSSSAVSRDCTSSR